MEDQDYVGSHTLISDDDFFTTIDDKVTTLIENALFGILSYLFVVQASQLAEVRTNHNRYLPKEYLHFRLLILDNKLAVPSLNLSNFDTINLNRQILSSQVNHPFAIFIFLSDNFLQLSHLHVDIYLSGICQVPQASLMRIYWLVALICLLNTWE
jgi:hypothetical protein